jgi:O-antigen/teichoic acid export membrane protein
MTIIRNTSFYTIGRFFPKAAGFFMLPIFSRYLSPEDYGILGSMEVLAYFMSLFFTLTLEFSIHPFYADYKTE